MSDVMSQMNKHRAEMMNSEKDAAVLRLAKHLHECVEPRITPQMQHIQIFNSRDEFAQVFDAEKPVMVAAADRVLEELANSGYVEGKREQAYLTRRGFEAFTQSDVGVASSSPEWV